MIRKFLAGGIRKEMKFLLGDLLRVNKIVDQIINKNL